MSPFNQVATLGDEPAFNGRSATEYARLRDAQLQAALQGRLWDSVAYADQARALAGQASRGTTSENRRAARRPIIKTSAAIAAGLLMSWMPVSASVAQEAGVAVRTAPVEIRSLVDRQQVTGSLRAVSRAAVASEESGAVARVAVDEGESVRAGDVIASLDARRHEARLAEAEAELTTLHAIVAERDAELLQARSDLDALDALRARNAATEREHRDAQTAVRVAEARLLSAQRQVESGERGVDLARIALADMNVVAPFDGRVVVRHVEPGEWIDPGDPVITLVSGGVIEARLEVPERFAPALAAGDGSVEVTVETTIGTISSAQVRAVPQVDARARTFPVVIELDDTENRLSPGMSVTAWVPAGPSESRTTVPKDAVVRSAVGAHVFVAEPTDDGGHVATWTSVRVLFTTDDRVALAEGSLQPGQLVVIEGNERLRPDSPLVLLHAAVHQDTLAAAH